MTKMITPILAFMAVTAGSPYPRKFTSDDELDVDSEVAEVALNLGRLSNEDAQAVREALGLRRAVARC